MILTTGKAFDLIRLEPYPDYHGLVVEFQPAGHNAVSGSSVIKVQFGFIMLPSGKVGLTILSDNEIYKVNNGLVIVEDSLGSDRVILKNGIELERIK